MIFGTEVVHFQSYPTPIAPLRHGTRFDQARSFRVRCSIHWSQSQEPFTDRHFYIRSGGGPRRLERSSDRSDWDWDAVEALTEHFDLERHYDWAGPGYGHSLSERSRLYWFRQRHANITDFEAWRQYVRLRRFKRSLWDLRSEIKELCLLVRRKHDEDDAVRSGNI